MVERKGTRSEPRKTEPPIGAPKPSRKLLKGRLNTKVQPAAPLTGRQCKDLAMVIARELAETSGYSGFSHVLSKYEADHPEDSSLRIWASASDRNEIDMICERWRRPQPKRRR